MAIIVDVGLHRYFDHTDKKQHDGWFWLPDVGDFKPILDMYDYYTGILAAAPSQHAKMRRNPDEVRCSASPYWCSPTHYSPDVVVLQRPEGLQVPLRTVPCNAELVGRQETHCAYSNIHRGHASSPTLLPL